MSTHLSRFGAFTLAAVMASTIVVAPVVGQPSQDSAPTFRCDPGFYQVISGQLAELDPGNNTYTGIGADEASYNAVGYRIADGYLYGIRGTELLRVDADGAIVVVAELAVPSGAYTGDFGDDGLLHISRGGRDWHTVDVGTGAVVAIPELSGNYGMADIANVYGVFYGVSASGNLIRIDPTLLTVEDLGLVDGLPRSSASYGAAWSSAGGNLYVGRNSGEIFQVTGYSGADPIATQVATAPSTNSNDGASCSLAAAPPGIVDIDGPEPETEPSTPEAKAAAEQHEEQQQATYSFPSAGIPDGPSCTIGVDEDRPPRLAVNAEVVTSPTIVYSSGPSPMLADFDVLSGLWTEGSAGLEQTHDCGYDYTALLAASPLNHYVWESTVSAIDDLNRGGVVINQSSPLTRSGATLIDLAEGGDAVRWGFYDELGYYQPLGSANLELGQSDGGVTFTVEVHDDEVALWVDGSLIIEFSTANGGGLVGLVTSRTAASFTDITLTALPGRGGS